MSNLELNSVGTVIYANGITHPINADGTYDLDEGMAVHILDVDTEWFNSLSSEDLISVCEFVANDLVGDLGEIDLSYWITNTYNEWCNNQNYFIEQSEYSEVI